MNDQTHEAVHPKRKIPTWAIVLITMLLTVIATVLVLRYYFYPQPFNAVKLSKKEEKQLDSKLAYLIPGYQTTDEQGNTLRPEPYSEEGAERELFFNEREINTLLARNTDLSDRLAVDLSEDLVSAQLLVPLEPDFPVMGGKTVRITAGMGLSYAHGRPVAILRGISVMGIPLPNDWIGGLKNVDLIQEFGGQDGFWKSFAGGIEFLDVKEGRIHVKLKE